MSLKYFHPIFIVFAILCDAGFWFWTHLAREDAEHMGTARLGAFAGWVAIALTVYGVWYLVRKSRRIII